MLILNLPVIHIYNIFFVLFSRRTQHSTADAQGSKHISSSAKQEHFKFTSEHQQCVSTGSYTPVQSPMDTAVKQPQPPIFLPAAAAAAAPGTCTNAKLLSEKQNAGFSALMLLRTL